MADLGTLITIADKVFQLLQSQVLKDRKDWESNLDNLKKSVSFIKTMLLDADMKPELSHGEHAWVEELKEVLYEADDLFDEVITISKMKELDEEDARFSKKLLDKVSRFFSSKNHVLTSYHNSREVKTIQQKLDAIAKDHARYEFKVDPRATMNRREDTCSFLDEIHENIIGRDDDVEDVIDMLLDPNVEENVGFVVIVGIGGLGKTTLARLVYNHDEITSRFEKKLWVCVSDQDAKKLDVLAILVNIIEASTNKMPSDVTTIQSIQTKFAEELKERPYLLILDDLWTEDPIEWSKLRRYLTIGGLGSRVVITTRSEKTAEVVLEKCAHSKMYMLKGLSDENSWHLFVLTAFEREWDEVNETDLTEIGKNIVKKCSNVPLAIKVLGTLLYGQTHRWKLFEENRLPQIETAKNPIMSILKLSYNNLEPFVKNCFKYCALFPKDFKMNKRELICLWMAQGYIVDSEDCFSILLKRCFFQDVEKDNLGDVYFKMHDLIHDLAQEVAGDEFIVANSLLNNLSKRNRHLFIDGGIWTNTAFQKINIRTCYMNKRVNPDYVNRRVDSEMVRTLVTNWCCLRSLCLYLPKAKKISESIGQLLHLRYLDLSTNSELETLPNSIVKLYNLQGLILYLCSSLKDWPKYFYKLVNLRLLDIRGCFDLSCMPLGIGKLTNLRGLSNFKVEGVSSIGKPPGGELKDLKFLVNLRGKLVINMGEILASEEQNVWDGDYLEGTKNLKVVEMYFYWNASETNDEASIAKLQPNRNLMQLRLYEYNGSEIPRWGRAQDDWASILPNLVEVELLKCERLQGIPLLSQLKHLKTLSLEQLNNLGYMDTNAISHDTLGSKNLPFFPSLEYLKIWHLERLKGWWGEVGEGASSMSMPHCQPSFPRLSKLSISVCPELTSFPPCPFLESLVVTWSNKSLQILPGEGATNLDLELKVQKVDFVGYLTTLPACRLTHVKIEHDNEVTMLSEVEEIFKNSSSLRSLEIAWCPRLTSISGGLEHLTSLKSLSLKGLYALEDDEIPWRALRDNLRSLELDTLEILPRGMKHLTALQKLSIINCKSLTELPEWISCLSSLHTFTIDYCRSLKSLGTIINMTSLHKLGINGCPELTEACKEPSGKEWPNIQHIPHFSIKMYW